MDTEKQQKPNTLHPSIRNFTPLPSDPAIKLTTEQLNALFPHPEVWSEVISRVQEMQPSPADGAA